MTDIIGLVGATLIFTWSSLFDGVREIYPKMLKCSMCVGFWVGIFGGIARQKDVVDTFLLGTTVSIVSFITYLILLRLQFQGNVTIKKEG